MFNRQFLRAVILRRGSTGSFRETPYENYRCPVSPLMLGRTFWLFINFYIVQVS